MARSNLIREALAKRGFRGPTRSSEAYQKLHQAYMSGSEEAMVAVFDEHPELGEMCPADGVTLLHQMAGMGALLLMQWLLNHGADVNAQSEQGWTPLDFAASGRAGGWIFDNKLFERVATFLLEHGARLSPLSAATPGTLGLPRFMFEGTTGRQGRARSGRQGQPPGGARPPARPGTRSG